MAYMITSTSDDSDNSEGDSISWTSPVWRRNAHMWAEWRRGWQVPPPAPTPTESSHTHGDGLHLYDLDEPIGMWVTPNEAQHARILSRVHAEQLTRIEGLEGQLYNSQDMEAAAQSMYDMLGERVAEISVKFCELGLALSRARLMIKTLVLALIVYQVVCVALLFK